jgi:MFS family permease
VGIALTVGGIARILTQTPAGALVDHSRSKRSLIAAGVVALAVGALLVALVPTFGSVRSAQVLIGGTSSVFGPAICAVSLGIVGRAAFDTRPGRNQTLNSAGNVVAAVAMGLFGQFNLPLVVFIGFAIMFLKERVADGTRNGEAVPRGGVGLHPIAPERFFGSIIMSRKTDDSSSMKCQTAHNRCWRVGWTASDLERNIMVGTILVVLLVLMLLGSFPTWPHSRNWGYYPSGGLGAVLAIVVVLLLLGRI